jgi:hypothetical protein
MTTISYSKAWAKDVEANQSGHDEILTWDPFKNWEINRSPEGSVEDDVLLSAKILFGNGRPALAKAFLEQGLKIAERIVKEIRLKSPLCADTFPKNRASLFRSMAYARMMLGGALDERMLQQASADYEQWCATTIKSKKWDEMDEAWYLDSVRLALIGGDRARAKGLLEERRSFRWQREEAALLMGLASAPGVPLKDARLQERFEAFFDLVRNPHYKSEVFCESQVLRIELGMLRDKYLISPDGTIDWPRTVAAISR